MAHEAGRFVLYSEPHCPLHVASRVIRHGPTDLEKGSLSRGEYLRDDRECDSPLVCDSRRVAWRSS